MAGTKAQLMNDISPVDGATKFSEGAEITEYKPVPGMDVFSVMPEERKEFGIEDHETVAWIRNPKVYEKHEGSNRLREFKRERPGARQIFTDDGDEVTLHDTILCAYPTIHKEREEAQRTKEYLEYVNGDPNAEAQAFDRVRARQLVEGMKRQNRMEGMIGPQSPTAGQSLRSAYERYGPEAIEREEAKYRAGSRQQSFDSQDWANIIDGNRAEVRRERKAASKTVAMGDTGFGRNPNSAVAQAARRQGGK